MKKLNLIVALLIACVAMTGCYNENESRQNVLKIYNWGDYIGEGVLEDFQEYYKEQTGEDIHIVYQTFDINEVMLTKIEKGHEDFDVVCLSEYIIERMLHKDLLLPIDTVFAHSPNYMNGVAPYIREQIAQISTPDKPVSRYAVCYMWGTAGLLYNTKYVSAADMSTWDCLWNKRFAGRILMKDSYRDAYGTALLYAYRKDLEDGKKTVKQLMNDYSPAAMDTVEKYLKLLKPNVAGWAIDEAESVGVELAYEVPREGSNIWYDGWVIPKYARNVKAASYFINFLCRPDVALRNMEEIGYVSSIASPEIMDARIDTTLEDYVDASYFFGEIGRHVKLHNTQYPDISVVNRCSMIRDFGDKTVEVLEIWQRVKGDNLNSGIVLLIFVVVFALCVWRIHSRWQKYKRQRMQRRKRRRK